MPETVIWWFLIEIIGLAVLPIAFRFFRNLPDRGYAFIKPLGLLLIAYPFWLLTTFGFTTNTRGAIAVIAVGVAALSWWLAGTTRNENRGNSSAGIDTRSIGDWLYANKSLVIATELVFTVTFLGWALIRAYMPDISATEKPMELAFLNSVLQSEHFPPLDPWLSGYAISYYYFGYVIAAMLTMLSGIPSNITFNLMIALSFALASTGAFGLAFNLIRSSTEDHRHANHPSSTRNAKEPISTVQQLFFALFAPLFLVLAGNLEGLFESLHTRGLGSFEFWNWLDVKGLVQAPITNTFVPLDNWWWWRASRVIHDVVNGQTHEVIDEFPQFSFVLGDMHPHVLALPFVLLALAVALNLLKSDEPSKERQVFSIAGWQIPVFRFDLLLLPLILGGLFFLNSWDILPYGFILVAAYVLARYRVADKWDRHSTIEASSFVLMLGGLSIVLYLPFYLGFQSQAGGILPTLFVKTRLHQYLLMFGLFVFIMGAFVIRMIYEKREINWRDWRNRLASPLTAVVSFPLLIAAFALVVIGLTPALQDEARAAFPAAADNFAVSVLAAFFGPLVRDPWLFILLGLGLSLIFVLAREFLSDDSKLFVLLLALTAFLLTFGVEFVYLRDQFGSRMNTVFKFYFQTWTLLSIAAAFSVYYLSRVLNGIVRGAWFIALGLLLAASMIYPAMAVPNRADDFNKAPTLDGIAYIKNLNAGDYEAIQWLTKNAPRGAIVLEAPGAEYSYDNRISMATGLPTVLGWAGHEMQWRGNSKFYKDDATGVDRARDVQIIYQSIDSRETLTLLDKYAIKFVVVGQIERGKYNLSKTQIDKFGKVMTLVFEYGDVRIYARTI
jgi:YYY domain-containing protein